MLVDTGSAVTINRADIWEKVSKCTVSTLARTTQAVVAANGKGLQLDGQVVLNIYVCVCGGGVACGLAFPCCKGSDTRMPSGKLTFCVLMVVPLILMLDQCQQEER